MDALHAQHDTARAVLDRRADYVMTVKANMPTLYAQLKKLPWKNVPGFSHVAKDHGRRTRRTVKAFLAPAWVEFDGAAQVAQVRRTVTRKGKKTVEVVYVITRADGLCQRRAEVAGRAVDRAEDAEVELDEVERLYNEHGMWDSAFPLS